MNLKMKEATLDNLKELRRLSSALANLVSSESSIVDKNKDAIVVIAQGLIDISESTKEILVNTLDSK